MTREIFDRVGPARRAADRHFNAEEIRKQIAVKEDATRGVFSLFFTTGRIDMAQLRDVIVETSANEISPKKDKMIDIRHPLRSLNVSFVAISDGLLGRIGKEGEAMVRFYPDSPRLQIAELNTSDRRFTLDLRRDRVRAVAPGAPAESVFYGQVFRGVVEGSLERAVAELLTTEPVRKEKWAPVVSTSTLFERANSDRVRVVLFGGNHPLPVEMIPEDARARARHALAGGKWVIAPEHALAVGGRKRFAWWQVDPRSGETIAVTDDGLHGTGGETATTTAIVSPGPVAGTAMVIVYEGGAIVDAVIVLATRVSIFLATVGPDVTRVILR